MPYQIGVYSLGNDGQIPPKQESFVFESGCRSEMPFEIVPLFYRVHTHDLGVVVSGYAVINNTWYELGRMSPQQKQQFYRVNSQNLIVDPYDYLTSKCTYNTMSRNEITKAG